MDDISLQVALLSGESVELRACLADSVNALRLQTQHRLGVKVSSLVAADGRLLSFGGIVNSLDVFFFETS